MQPAIASTSQTLGNLECREVNRMALAEDPSVWSLHEQALEA
jgi:hypothetical protein